MGVAATVAVVPFENPSGDPAQAYLARGFVEELITELARFPTLDVIHPDSAGAADGAGYLLRGSVRRLGELVRIAVQLVEAPGGRQIAHGRGLNRAVTGEVGRAICAGLRAFGRGRHREAIDELAPVRDRAWRFGGSHAQRDVLTLTLIEAAIRGGHPRLARHFLAERQVLKPASRWAGRLLARAA